VSTSSRKAGRQVARQVIGNADERWCAREHPIWTTEDLGDFVSGLVEESLNHLLELAPELIRTDVRCPDHPGELHASVIDLSDPYG
jgi:hypothetical protein